PQRLRRLAPHLGARPARAAAARAALARTRRRDLGGAGRAPALHPLQGDGLGRLRPRHPLLRGARPRRTSRALARDPGRDPRPGLPPGLERRAPLVPPVVRRLAAGRQPAAAAPGRLPATRGSPRPRPPRRRPTTTLD